MGSFYFFMLIDLKIIICNGHIYRVINGKPQNFDKISPILVLAVNNLFHPIIFLLKVWQSFHKYFSFVYVNQDNYLTIEMGHAIKWWYLI